MGCDSQPDADLILALFRVVSSYWPGALCQGAPGSNPECLGPPLGPNTPRPTDRGGRQRSDLAPATHARSQTGRVSTDLPFN